MQWFLHHSYAVFLSSVLSVCAAAVLCLFPLSGYKMFYLLVLDFLLPAAARTLLSPAHFAIWVSL